jgi:CO/xanthine dehydrogenase Mo-binding subunit
MTVHERSTTRFDESIRPDVPSKISGEFEYSNDVRVPGMLFGATKRCPHAHARLSKIDSSKALAMPGVRRVFTHEDVPEGRLLGHITHDQPVFVVDVARHQGEPVAFVVADTQELAWQALEAIDVSWQTLEPVTTIEEALTSDPIHPQGTLNVATRPRAMSSFPAPGRRDARINSSLPPRAPLPTPTRMVE